MMVVLILSSPDTRSPDALATMRRQPKRGCVSKPDDRALYPDYRCLRQLWMAARFQPLALGFGASLISD
jgi:hypothetical protein